MTSPNEDPLDLAENKSEDLLKQAQELGKRVKETSAKIQNDEFSPFEGELPIKTELHEAINTLMKLQYRGVRAWKVYVVYLFTEKGIQTKTSVRSSDGPIIELTESEAIAIASWQADQTKS